MVEERHWGDPLACKICEEEDRRIITEAVHDPKNRQLVIDTLRELGYMVATPPSDLGSEPCGG